MRFWIGFSDQNFKGTFSWSIMRTVNTPTGRNLRKTMQATKTAPYKWRHRYLTNGKIANANI